MKKAAVILCLIALAGAAASAAPADKSQTATGTIARLQASERSIEVTLADGSQARFSWSPETKISGVLTPGARITLRYTVGADGKNLAQQITVARN